MLPEPFLLPDPVAQALLAHSGDCEPNEACGLLASDERGSVRFAYLLSNLEASPISYTIDPDEHFGALQHAESRGWHLSAVFHSHPGGIAAPSTFDVKGALEPRWTYLIVGSDGIRAFSAAGGTLSEVGVRIVRAQSPN